MRKIGKSQKESSLEKKERERETGGGGEIIQLGREGRTAVQNKRDNGRSQNEQRLKSATKNLWVSLAHCIPQKAKHGPGGQTDKPFMLKD